MHIEPGTGIRRNPRHGYWKTKLGPFRLDPDKLVVTACPLKDRAIIAMTYLMTKGFNVKYLSDGMLGLAEYLRGDMALELTDVLPPTGEDEFSESLSICPG